MGDLSAHFSRSEFACKCGCGACDVDNALIALLERIRALVDKPVYVNSGVRCYAHNRSCGGASCSQHLLGMAADIHVKDMSPKTLAKSIDSMVMGGMGVYASFVHVDVRQKRVRW